MFQTLEIEIITPTILLLTLNRPTVYNAINSQMMTELLEFWQTVFAENKKWRCIVITGKGKAFSAGADLKERYRLPLEIWKMQHSVLRKAMRAMLDCPVPVIAAVNGFAFGGGLELMLACDFAYASTTALFGQSEVKVGLMPGAFGTQTLPRSCSLKRAKELIFTGKTFSAKDALSWGIVNQLTKPADLLNDVFKTAQTISENAPIAILEAKKALKTSEYFLQDVRDYELESYQRVLLTRDRIKGIDAFNEKKKPEFSGD